MLLLLAGVCSDLAGWNWWTSTDIFDRWKFLPGFVMMVAGWVLGIVYFSVFIACIVRLILLTLRIRRPR